MREAAPQVVHCRHALTCNRAASGVHTAWTAAATISAQTAASGGLQEGQAAPFLWDGTDEVSGGAPAVRAEGESTRPARAAHHPARESLSSAVVVVSRTFRHALFRVQNVLVEVIHLPTRQT